jgi:catechol 2,3-dioxygenase-like lactoylglutathione lyase family enzyme
MNGTPRGIHHVAIKTRGWEETLALYETLGFRLRADLGAPGRRVGLLVADDGTSVEVIDIADPTPEQQDEFAGGGYHHVCLHTDDLDAALAAALAAGGTLVVPIWEASLIPSGGTSAVPHRLATFRGLDGELVELIEGLDWSRV